MPSRRETQLSSKEKERHWQARAACRQGVDPEIFFPVSLWGPIDWTGPRQICESCPVREACLEYALRSHEPYGMWGGATPVQRSAMIKRNSTNDEQ